MLKLQGVADVCVDCQSEVTEHQVNRFRNFIIEKTVFACGAVKKSTSRNEGCNIGRVSFEGCPN